MTLRTYATLTNLRHPLFHGRGDLLDEHPQSWRRRHAPEDEGGKTVVDRQVGQDADPVVARPDDLLVLVADARLDDRGNIAAEVVDASDRGGVAPGGAGRLVDDRVGPGRLGG